MRKLLALIPPALFILGVGWIFFMVFHFRPPAGILGIESAMLLLIYCCPGILAAAFGLMWLTFKIH